MEKISDEFKKWKWLNVEIKKELLEKE